MFGIDDGVDELAVRRPSGMDGMAKRRDGVDDDAAFAEDANMVETACVRLKRDGSIGGYGWFRVVSVVAK